MSTWTRVCRLLAERSAAGPSCSGSPMTSRLSGELTACPLISRLSPRLWTGVPLTMRWPFSAIASAPALRKLLSASCNSKSRIVPRIWMCNPGPWTGSSPLTSRKVVSSFWIAFASVPPAVSASRICASCCERAAPCWSNWLLARFRSLISSATLVSSWAARLRATAACERSWTTTRKPSAMAITLTTISRWARAVASAERLRILHQEGGIRHDALAVDCDRLRSAHPQDVDDVLQVLVVNRPAQGTIARVVGVAAIVQQDGQPGPVECGQPGDQLLVIELGFHLLKGARAAGALVFAGLDPGLESLDPGRERPVLVLELRDALAQRLVSRQPVGGGQWLASELGRREAGDEECGQRNACQDSHPRRHGAV